MAQTFAKAGWRPLLIERGADVQVRGHQVETFWQEGVLNVESNVLYGEGGARLYEATLSAARYNPSVRAIYRRLKERGKPEKVARTAAARKLLSIAHAIYQSGEPFREPNQKET